MDSDEPAKTAAAPVPEDLAALQFDRAEPVEAPVARPCPICGSDVVDNYYLLNGHRICAKCGEANDFTNAEEPTTSDLARAATYGAGAALAGTAAYFAILAVSGYEIGLIAIAVGWLVGKAVNKGGRGLGGRKLQVLAVALTYFSIVGSYVPLIIKYAVEHRSPQNQSASDSTPAVPDKAPAVQTEAPPPSIGRFVLLILMLFAYCLALPFLQGFSGLIGLFIIFIGLFEAWKWNRRARFTFEGPFPVTPAASGS